MTNLNYKNLVNPYDKCGFVKQLLETGVSLDTIIKMESSFPKGKPDENLLYWLYEDIRKKETEFLSGERYILFTSIFCTDSTNVLVERNKYLGTQGKKYQLGGLLAVDEEPIDCAVKELTEETPLTVVKQNFKLITELHYDSESPKVPGVKTHKKGYLFKYNSEPLLNIPGVFTGNKDNEIHELLVILNKDILTNDQVDENFQKIIKEYSSELL